ncbi:MAG: tyrosine-type recombinase/integrase [Chloroflexota bacterium]
MPQRATPTGAADGPERAKGRNGSGSVVWRKWDRRWSAKLTRVEDGRQVPWVKYAPANPDPSRRTKARDRDGEREAQRLLGLMLDAAAAGLWKRLEPPAPWEPSAPFSPSGPRVGELFSRFLAEAYALEVSPEQLKNARGFLANHLAKAEIEAGDPEAGRSELVAFADLPVADVRTRDVLDLLDHRLRAGAGDGTRRHLYNVLAKAWDWFVLRDECDANVVRAARRPVVRDAEDRDVWTLDEARAFFAHPAVRSDRFEAAYRLGANPGLRIAEILALTWADVDEDGCQVQVSHQLKRRHVEGHARKQLVRVDQRKGGFERSWRGVHPETADALRRRRAAMAAEAAAHGQELLPGSLVFVTREGRPLDPNDFRPDEFYRVVAAAGARKVDFHSLRYVGETADAMALVPEKVAMQQRGRKTPEMRLHYTRPADEAQIAAAKASGDLLFGGEVDGAP